MESITDLFIPGLIIVLAIMIGLQVFDILDHNTPKLISCPEDCVIVGRGDYNKGYWTKYVCIPLDDIGDNGVYWSYLEGEE